MTSHSYIGFFPFWFWNDDLSADEIRWQIGQMKQQGVRGFVLSPRQGLQQPYLADAFFELVDVAVQSAKEHGLIVHLYDELPYPSGPAGGEALLGNPHFYATALVQQSYPARGKVRIELPRGNILSCVAVPVTANGADWNAAIDLSRAVGVVLSEDAYQEVGLTSYNRKRYFANVAIPTLQTTLPDEPHVVFVSAQTTVTGHKYYDQFLDVLNPAAVAEFIRLTHQRYADRFPNDLGNIIQSIFTDETTPTWSECIPREFLARIGYDLLPLLPALQDENHPKHAQVKADFHRVKYELFVEAFEKPIARWCRDHKIAYWAEKPLLRLSQLQFSDVPGCDAGHVRMGAPLDMVNRELRMNPRAAASAAYFYDKPAALCECYHSLGWGATLADLKRLADGLLLHGINCFVPHAFFYSTHNLRKHDAPPSMFFQMPSWKFFGQMVNHGEKVLSAFAGTYIDAQVLVVDPSPGVPTPAQLDDFFRLQNLLLQQHVDYLLVDVDTLQTGRCENGVLHIKDLKIQLVLVPPMLAIEPALRDWITRYTADGGSVVELRDNFDPTDLVARLPARSLEITALEGDASLVHLVTRKDADRTLWFLHNTGFSPVTMRLGVWQTKRMHELHLTGNESILLTPDTMPRGVYIPPVQPKLPGQWAIQPLNENLLPLADWHMELMQANFATQSAAVQPAPLIHQLTKGNFQYAPVVQRPFGATATLTLPMFSVRYTAEFEVATSTVVHLVMEPGSIAGDWTLAVNAQSVGSFEPTDMHIRGSLAVDVTSLLVPGVNRIEINLNTDRVDGGLLNCLYLAGDFGVAVSPLRIIASSSLGEFGRWDENGLPFFAGVVEYRGTVDFDGDERIIELPIDTNLLGEDAYEASFNHGPWHPVLWSPRTIELAPDEVHRGSNDLRVRVYTTLLRAFERQRFDVPTHRAVDV